MRLNPGEPQLILTLANALAEQFRTDEAWDHPDNMKLAAAMPLVYRPDQGFTVDQTHMRVFVGNLRKKLETDQSVPPYIITEPWVGYRFEPGD